MPRVSSRWGASPARPAPELAAHPHLAALHGVCGARGARCWLAFCGLAYSRVAYSWLAFWVASLLLAAPNLGCGAGGAASGPRETLRSYAIALREQRVEDAYALLSRDVRAHLSLAEFTRMVSENGREIEDISRSLLQPAEPAQITATLTSPDGDTLRLVYENDAWHVDGSAFDLYSQATPRAALESFLRAYSHKRYDVLLRFVPDAKRSGLSAEQLKQAWEGDQRQQLERLTQALAASLPNLRIEMLGTRATVAYGPGATIELVQEQGSWRIEDF